MNHLENWGKLTQNANTLSTVPGFKIPFSKNLLQCTLPQIPRVTQEKRLNN